MSQTEHQFLQPKMEKRSFPNLLQDNDTLLQDKSTPDAKRHRWDQEFKGTFDEQPQVHSPTEIPIQEFKDTVDEQPQVHSPTEIPMLMEEDDDVSIDFDELFPPINYSVDVEASEKEEQGEMDAHTTLQAFSDFIDTKLVEHGVNLDLPDPFTNSLTSTPEIAQDFIEPVPVVDDIIAPYPPWVGDLGFERETRYSTRFQTNVLVVPRMSLSLPRSIFVDDLQHAIVTSTVKAAMLMEKYCEVPVEAFAILRRSILLVGGRRDSGYVAAPLATPSPQQYHRFIEHHLRKLLRRILEFLVFNCRIRFLTLDELVDEDVDLPIVDYEDDDMFTTLSVYPQDVVQNVVDE